MEYHPLSEVYPLMPADELQRLADDIKENGLRFDITTYEGKILDGRNRYQACGIAAVEPRYKPLRKGLDPEAFVVSANEHRRDLVPEWKTKHRQERIERVAEARKSGQSIRTIAEDEDVSRAQVERDLKESAQVSPPPGTPASAASVDAPKSEAPKVTGRDGKAYPARKPKPAPRKPPKKKNNGKPSYDDRIFDKNYGALVRYFDERARAAGKCAEFDECMKISSNLHAAFKRWQVKTR